MNLSEKRRKRKREREILKIKKEWVIERKLEGVKGRKREREREEDKRKEE